jgi:hypothetical protein
MHYRQHHAIRKVRIYCANDAAHQILVALVSVRAYDNLLDYITEYLIHIDVLGQLRH